MNRYEEDYLATLFWRNEMKYEWRGGGLLFDIIWKLQKKIIFDSRKRLDW